MRLVACLLLLCSCSNADCVTDSGISVWQQRDEVCADVEAIYRAVVREAARLGVIVGNDPDLPDVHFGSPREVEIACFADALGCYGIRNEDITPDSNEIWAVSLGGPVCATPLAHELIHWVLWETGQPPSDDHPLPWFGGAGTVEARVSCR